MPRNFGVEIECLAPITLGQGNIASLISNAGVSCIGAGYTHTLLGSWKVVSDRSLTSEAGFDPHEIVSPILTLERLEEIDKVCGALAGARCKVNRSCGLHVHVDARDLPLAALKRLAVLYIESEDVVDSLLPPSRRGDTNAYCRTLKESVDVITKIQAATDVLGIARAIRQGGYPAEANRYVKLNFVAFTKYKTVEFRQHSSTIDPVKVKNWVIFCLKMVETAVREASLFNANADEYRAAPEAAPYWRRGRRTRAIYALLTRPEGATAEEVRVALGIRSRPDIRWHLERSGVTPYQASTERREGNHVWRLPSSTAATQATAMAAAVSIVTLDSLMDKLQMSAQERVYWTERAAMLSAARE